MLKNKPLAMFLCLVLAAVAGALSFGLDGVRATSLPFVYDYSSHDLGTSAVEISGMTYDGSRDRLLVLDNAERVVLHEFAIDTATGYPVEGPRRQIQLVGMGGDVEGVTWIAGDAFAVIDENTGHIHRFVLPDGTEDLTIEGSDSPPIETGIEEGNGFGAEGLTYLPNHNGQDWFIAVDEGPTTITAVSADGTSDMSVSSLTTPTLGDFSAVFISPQDGMLYIVSDATSTVAQFQSAGSLSNFVEIASQTLTEADLRQVEGLTFNPAMTHMYVGGETETNDGNGFGLWTTPVSVPPQGLAAE